MPAEPSAADPGRLLRLLWRREDPGSGRGRRPGLSIDAVVGAATRLADSDGLEAVTMRRVADGLSVAPMTLYTYVPGKAELLDLMLDAAYAAMPRSDTAGKPWRDRLTAVAAENKALFEAHPWASAVSSRPPLGPGLMAKYEHELSALDGLGLGEVEMDDCLTLVLTFVQACALGAAAAHAARRASGIDDAQWWEVNGPLLARVVDDQAYPLAARVGSAAGAAHGSAYDGEHAYVFGLARILDGLTPLIETARRSVPR